MRLEKGGKVNTLWKRRGEYVGADRKGDKKIPTSTFLSLRIEEKLNNNNGDRHTKNFANTEAFASSLQRATRPWLTTFSVCDPSDGGRARSVLHYA